jgi:Ca2+-binding EF-hand superfamily protein
MSISGIGSQGGFNPTKMAAQFFKKADGNGDDGIDKAELKKMLSNGPTGNRGGTDIDKVFSEVDADKNGKISQAENENSMKKMGSQGRQPPSGPPPGGMGGGGMRKSGANGGSASSSETDDEKDTNKDGTVSLQEEMAYTLKQSSGESETKTSTSSTLLDKIQKGQQYDSQGSINANDAKAIILSFYA